MEGSAERIIPGCTLALCVTSATAKRYVDFESDYIEGDVLGGRKARLTDMSDGRTHVGKITEVIDFA
ncbi:hypothetical protein AGR7A_Cc140020 [Agrobacterium deltaense NCPPB 1641]|uniref:Uncharacterized protein n=1 Tax=Agrobacterium deltaense NCPPB 1641 TaxID=1183425 RepID=A0A1S7TJX9_9HYPH|nr:hypothetical protein AGR7A_Cc140020 [Agrobacterium deltaense NCPPB 1641]